MDPYKAPESPALTAEALQEKLFKHRAAVRGGGGTVIFIGIATAINIALAAFQVQLFFPIGLYYPLALAELWPSLVGLVGSTAVCAFLYLILGRKARGGSQMAFTIALVLYAVDTVIPALSKDWLGVGLHAFFLFSLVGARGNIRLVQETEEQLRRMQGSRETGPTAHNSM